MKTTIAHRRWITRPLAATFLAAAIGPGAALSFGAKAEPYPVAMLHPAQRAALERNLCARLSDGFWIDVVTGEYGFLDSPAPRGMLVSRCRAQQAQPTGRTNWNAAPHSVIIPGPCPGGDCVNILPR
jgi:hypothetical protein